MPSTIYIPVSVQSCVPDQDFTRCEMKNQDFQDFLKISQEKIIKRSKRDRQEI